MLNKESKKANEPDVSVTTAAIMENVFDVAVNSTVAPAPVAEKEIVFTTPPRQKLCSRKRLADQTPQSQGRAYKVANMEASKAIAGGMHSGCSGFVHGIRKFYHRPL